MQTGLRMLKVRAQPFSTAFMAQSQYKGFRSNLTVPQRKRGFCAVKVGSVHTDKDYHEALCASFRLPRLPNSTFLIFHGISRIQVITGITIAVGEGEIQNFLL